MAARRPVDFQRPSARDAVSRWLDMVAISGRTWWLEFVAESTRSLREADEVAVRWVDFLHDRLGELGFPIVFLLATDGHTGNDIPALKYHFLYSPSYPEDEQRLERAREMGKEMKRTALTAKRVHPGYFSNSEVRCSANRFDSRSFAAVQKQLLIS